MKSENKNFLKKRIDKKDILSFKNWIDEKKIFLDNHSFFTEIYNLSFGENLPNSLIEFLIYDHFFLKDKYLELEDFFSIKINRDLEKEDFILMFFSSLSKEGKKNIYNKKSFLEFLSNSYLFYNDEIEEIDFAKKYWKFALELKNSKVRDFNKYLILILKHFFDFQVGAKKI